MKRKFLFSAVVVTGIIYFLFEIIAYSQTTKSPTTYIISGAMLLKILVFVSFILLAAAIVLHMFFSSKCKYTLVIVWLACFVFAILFFVQDINLFAGNISQLRTFIASQRRLLDVFIDNPEQLANMQSIIQGLENTVLSYQLRIIANSIFLAGSAVTFSSLTVFTFYRTRSINAE